MDRNEVPYTHKQELWNSITHLVGFLFALAVSIMFVIYHIHYSVPFKKIFPFYVYSFFMMVMFGFSTLYHSSKFDTEIRDTFRVIDHCDIFCFVAATYTPICVLAIHQKNIALPLMIVQLVLTMVGVIINAFWLDKKSVRIISYILYIIQGWAIIFIYPFNQCLEHYVFLFTLLGGIVYSVGAISYAIGKKKIWFHTLFHFTILIAAALQFVGIYLILNSII